MKHIKSYRIFENKNKEVVDEFFSVMQGTPEGTDFMKWFVCDPKRTGRVYITPIRGTGVYIPKAFFDKISDNKWKYSYSSSGGIYGEKYGDLISLFINMITDGVAKNLPPGIKKSEFEEYLKNNPITPGTLPSNINPIIDSFINSERKGLINNLHFLKNLPWIKNVTDSNTYYMEEKNNGILRIVFNGYDTEKIGIPVGLKDFLWNVFKIDIYTQNNIQVLNFIPGTKGKKRSIRDKGVIFDFYLGYGTEEEIINVAESEINKLLSSLKCDAIFSDRNNGDKKSISFIKDNLESLIKYGSNLPGYNERINDFIADIIAERAEIIKDDYSNINLLKGNNEIIDLLRIKRPDIFGKSEEATKDLIKGVSALKRFGTFDND